MTDLSKIGKQVGDAFGTAATKFTEYLAKPQEAVQDAAAFIQQSPKAALDGLSQNRTIEDKIRDQFMDYNTSGHFYTDQKRYEKISENDWHTHGNLFKSQGDLNTAEFSYTNALRTTFDDKKAETIFNELVDLWGKKPQHNNENKRLDVESIYLKLAHDRDGFEPGVESWARANIIVGRLDTARALESSTPRDYSKEEGHYRQALILKDEFATKYKGKMEEGIAAWSRVHQAAETAQSSLVQSKIKQHNLDGAMYEFEKLTDMASEDKSGKNYTNLNCSIENAYNEIIDNFNLDDADRKTLDQQKNASLKAWKKQGGVPQTGG